ncbi:MAG: MotA/TolQ/ExbB proton channel family protein, partial [Halioglobus sp.]|nr:MotA/TolQ/ExbB proton channel family protein [Halioglobus sp.]
MNKKNIPVEFVYQLFALIIAIIVVHAFYVSVVRPNAAEVIEQQTLAAQQNPDYVRERSTWVLVKDMEQESCFILMFWA